jgi:atypical dual specificity phosphatase
MRRATDSIFIGNGTDGREHGDRFDIVVSVAAANEHTTHDPPLLLRDGEHDYETFAKAVDAVGEGMDDDASILVHCAAGLSRSVAVTIAALVAHSGWTFDDAFDQCKAGFIQPDPHLMDSAKRYVREHTTNTA